MMNEELLHIIKRLAESTLYSIPGVGKRPDYGYLYRMAAELYESSKHHLLKGEFPEKLFRTKSPGQSKAEYDYAKDNFRQVTLPIGMDYITTISRCLSAIDKNVVIDDKDFIQYAANGIREFNSINNWIASNLPMIKTLDPNGVIVINPGIKTYTDDDGSIRISSDMNEPYPEYFDSTRVVAYSDDKYVVIDMTDYLQKGRINIKKYYVIDDNSYYDVVYDTGKKTTAINIIYTHSWGYLPAQKLKGIPRFTNEGILWQSPLHYVTDLLDGILINASTLQNIIFKCGYPTRVYIGKKCSYSMKSMDGIQMTCDGGKINNVDTGTLVTCPSCNGTGYADRFSELHDYIIQPPSSLTEGETKVTVNPFSYIAPDTDIVRFLEDHIAKMEEKARKILHIQSSNSIIRGSENMTATGMVIDNKQMFAFIKPISDQIYDTIQFIYEGIGWMRYKKDMAVRVNRPMNFDFRSEKDYMEVIRMAYESGSPPFIIHSLIGQYAMNFYSSSERARLATQLILSADRLIGLSMEDINIYYAKGQVEDWELLIHQSPFSLIDELIARDESFLTSTDARERLMEYAKASAEASIATPSPDERMRKVLGIS